jgi:hypothetical protein
MGGRDAALTPSSSPVATPASQSALSLSAITMHRLQGKCAGVSPEMLPKNSCHVSQLALTCRYPLPIFNCFFPFSIREIFNNPIFIVMFNNKKEGSNLLTTKKMQDVAEKWIV